MFLYLRIELFAGDYQPRRSESEGPTDATKLAEAKLALENEAQRTLEPAALQLTTFLTSFFRAAEISQGERVWLRQNTTNTTNNYENLWVCSAHWCINRCLRWKV